MKQYIGEIESWIEQVRDDDLGVEDYDFIDNIVHKGKDGNNGLGQVGAYLAIYENEEGDIEPDKELIDALDERQSELPQGGKNRFSNIVYEGNTKKRDDNTLMDNEVNGHERLYSMLEAARDEFNNLSDKQAPENPGPQNQVSPNDNEYIISVDDGSNDTQNPKTGQAIPDGSMPDPTNTDNQGGDKMTFDDKVDEFFDKTEELTEYMSEEVAASTRQTYENANDIQDKAMAMYRRANALSDAMRNREEVDNAVLDEGMEDLQDFYREARGVAMTIDRAIETQKRTQYILHDRTELTDPERQFIEETESAKEILEERRGRDF